ncbi:MULTISPECIES: trehalose-phosphatase [Rhizobium]|nr:trehalose-phosphatase [Rhizobium sp. L58/93]MBO9134182.1 trehalose-phosphatase [Rhizobium sp. B209b/85]MBO9167205.1 trehalose-phosphatase [Rhizobium sp. L245/93]MBO9183163.1 trehalose-phosphatase [Rhizobium sp. E27B/91]QXZ79395.1 trehalose-phosphatase [Rhizobium sp. L51/94]QXZ83511.1 trehalose-phosphatase [Rhizobium sp. K1/93]QXZ88977.1 trehalose-phosphatase [Rhizobium sp. K15/93]QXZ96692.1 trehalose-phosphatase [Rhizobium sp. B230/85]QYA01564.1 trehalose-phosphatase [Rhizobium sp. B21/9
MSEQIQPATEATVAAVMESTALSALAAHPSEWALFLDIDGTLVDLAETPSSITVPSSLPYDLDALSKKLGGALALVTGRSLSFVDPLFYPFQFPVAGLHGAERRDAAGNVQRVTVTPAFTEMKRCMTEEASQWPGVLVEDKGAAVAAHYRLAPECQHLVEAMMERYFREAGPEWSLQRGKMVVEIRPARAGKGDAVTAFLSEAPFKGRRAFAAGDDFTDEAMFRTVNRIGGQSLFIGLDSVETQARNRVASPAILRQILAQLAS